MASGSSRSQLVVAFREVVAHDMRRVRGARLFSECWAGDQVRDVAVSAKVGGYGIDEMSSSRGKPDMSVL